LKLSLKHIIGDIRFWIILFFIVRLIGITNPPLEVSHNWRQTTVTMVSRNFLEVDNNILYPRVDFAGEKTGITGMEFPIFNYLIYLVAEVVGYSHWYGRLINLFFSSFGLWFFYLLIKKYIEPKIAFNATIILLVSLWFSFSRKIMPDTFSMSFIISSIYFGSNYLSKKCNRNNYWNLLLYVLFLSIGALAKLPSAYLLIVFLILFLDKRIAVSRKLFFSTASIIALIPIVFWYFYWFPHLVSTYGFWHFSMGRSFTQGASEILEKFPLALEQFYNNALKYLGFIAFLMGLVYSLIQQQKVLLSIFGLSCIGFGIVILKAGYVFTNHNYYMIPFIPVMALMASYGLSQIKNKKIAIVVLVSICLEGILNQQHDVKIHPKAMVLLQLEEDLDQISSGTDLIVINSNDTPTPMYFAHRKGWLDYNAKLKDKNHIKALKSRGLKLIVILKQQFGVDLTLNYPVVLDNENYRIYKIN
jgi:hypothetical protein